MLSWNVPPVSIWGNMMSEFTFQLFRLIPFKQITACFFFLCRRWRSCLTWCSCLWLRGLIWEKKSWRTWSSSRRPPSAVTCAVWTGAPAGPLSSGTHTLYLVWLSILQDWAIVIHTNLFVNSQCLPYTAGERWGQTAGGVQQRTHPHDWGIQSLTLFIHLHIWMDCHIELNISLSAVLQHPTHDVPWGHCVSRDRWSGGAAVYFPVCFKGNTALLTAQR